jgi:predicted thioesterase
MSNLLANVCVGMQGSVSIVVAEEHTAARVGSGAAPVLATPTLVMLLEAAALAAAERHLPAGHQSLGPRIDVAHLAATPLGMRVTAHAEVVAAEGRTLRFRVWAEDEREKVGEGTHERVVVETARFEKRLNDKATRTG